jgi:signal transduction histidine kinase/DNA-binding response OmpR family regulator
MLSHILHRSALKRVASLCILLIGVCVSFCHAQSTSPVFFKSWEATGVEKPVRGLSFGDDQNLYGYIDRMIYRYDGNRWMQMIEADRSGGAYFASKQGFYIGASGVANLYKPNPAGTFDVIDLNSEVSRRIKILPFYIQNTQDAVYFIGPDGIFAKNHAQQDGKLEHVWQTSAIAYCNSPDAFYIVDHQKYQLVKIQKGKAQVLAEVAKPGGQVTNILFLRCSAKGSLLMKSFTHQFFRYSPSSGLKPFSIQGLASNTAVRMYRALATGGYVFLLDTAQIIMTDEDGKILQQWSPTDLKLSSPPTDILADKQDRIWFTNADGMGYIDVRSYFEVPIQAESIPSVDKTLQDKENAYIITSENILRKKLSEAWNVPFQPIYTTSKGVIGDAALGKNNSLWACDGRQFVHLQNGTKTAFPSNTPCKVVETLGIAPEHVWVGDENGLRVLDKQGKVLSTQKIPVNDVYALSHDELLVQERKDKTDQFTKFKFDAGGNIISTTRYPEFTQQFLSLDHIFQYNGQIFIYDTEHVYRFERNNWAIATEIWQPNTATRLNAMQPAPDGKLWLVAEDRTGYFTVENGQYKWNGLPYRLDKRNSAAMLFALPDGSVMMRSLSGNVARIQPEAMKKPQAPIAVEVSAVFNHQSGEALYLGTKANLPASWILSTDVSTLRFHFGHREGAGAGIEYQTRLEGKESQWQAWNNDAERQYDNLSGSYTLHIRIRDGYGRIAETSFPFYVYPPWYARWWALSLWALLLVFGGYYGFQYSVRYRTKQIEMRNRELEAKVEERTETIARQTEELRTLDQAKTLFFGNVSHEFRTPLTLLSGWIQRIKQERIAFDSALGGEALNQMQSQIKNLQSLINQILDLTKIEAGRLELNKEKIDLVAFTKRFVGTFQSFSDYKQLFLQLDLPDTPVGVLADSKALEQVLGNLLSNAIKFTEAKGEIKVTIELEDNKFVVLTVTDTGWGISETDLPHIFDRFYQAKNDRNKQGGGTGIGLALSADLVKLHDGTLTVTSEEGKGSTFTLRLPISEDAPIFISEPIHAAEFVAPKFESSDSHLPEPNDRVSLRALPEDCPRLLIIEDQPDLRTFIRQMFEAEYVVYEAANGQEGLVQAQKYLPDLVICDVMMPVMNGFEVAVALQQHPNTKGIPFLFLTARAAEEDLKQGMALGAVDYVLKPFDLEILQLKVRNLLKTVRRNSLSKVPETSTPTSETKTETETETQGKAETSFQMEVQAFVVANLSNPNLTIDDFTEHLGLGRSIFYQQFKEEFGISPLVYLRNKRLEVAVDRLKQGELTVSEVAYQTGFNSVAYFVKIFREQYGKPPATFIVS